MRTAEPVSGETSSLSELKPDSLRTVLRSGTNRRFHPSFWEEISDFLGRRRIRRLAEHQQARILERIVELALEFSEPPTAGDVRRILFLLNDDRYRTGDAAAAKLLELEIEDLLRELRKTHGPGRIGYG